MKKIIMLVFLLLSLPGSLAWAEPEEDEARTSGDFMYVVLADGTAKITGYTGKTENLSIPEVLEGLRVTSIGKLSLHSGNSTISVTIPDSIVNIDANPFVQWRDLSSVVVSPEHPTFAVIEGVLFSKADNRLISCPCALAAESYSIPEGTAVIGEEAFSGCENLVSVMIPESVTGIGKAAFSRCENLVSVTIPESVTDIGEAAFSYCENLVSIELPESITRIEQGTFTGCDSLTTITIPDSVRSLGKRHFVDAARCPPSQSRRASKALRNQFFPIAAAWLPLQSRRI